MLIRFFFPHKHNGHRPHLFRLAGVAVLSGTLAVILGFAVLQNTVIRKTNFLAAVITSSVTDLTNADRTQAGLPALRTSALLTQAAQEKAHDMAVKGYFAHTSPAGVTPWHWFSDVGYDYIFAGENLAVNYSDSAAVVNAWMNSPTHRANILNSRYTEIGVASERGFYNGQDTVFVVQMFGMPASGQGAAVGSLSFLDFLAMPSTIIDNILIFLAAMIFLSLISVVVIEASRQHTQAMLLALLMLVIVFLLYFFLTPYIFSGTTII